MFVKLSARIVNMDNPRTPSDILAERVRQVRKRRGMTVPALAARCAERGAPQLTAQAIYKIEGQRESSTRPPRRLTVDELIALALALNAPPLYLLIPPDDPDEPYPLTATLAMSRANVADWFVGKGPIMPPLPLVGDTRQFYTELPEDKFQAFLGYKKDEASDL
jgi:transcriptional regulator with XRE-family HTH domain